MKRTLLFFASFLIASLVNAQEIKVKLMEYLPNDLAARTHPRPDANGVNCALIRVVVPAVKDMKFDGWVVGDYAYQPGEYQVYVPEGAKKIKFRHENYAPGEIVFNMPIESQCVYKVVLDVPDLGAIYVTQSSAMLAEGSRLFGLRKYKEARLSYEGALAAKDVVNDLIPTIQSDIAQCDTCILYETYTLGALGKIREMKALGEASQEQLVKYASAGIEYLQVLNKYNPCDFYVSRKTQLEGLIEGLPLEVRFTLVKWVNNAEGFFEAGKLANVEVWAYNGSEPPIHNDYKNDKKFKDLVGKSNNFTQLGTTDSEGIADVQLNRKSLPKGLFFRPIGYDDKIKILYMDLDELLIQSKGNYNKRRIRLKMFTAY
jgi:hypothetical protein